MALNANLAPGPQRTWQGVPLRTAKGLPECSDNRDEEEDKAEMVTGDFGKTWLVDQLLS